jgi:deoxyribodipyrimidine photo-lyase
MKSIFIFRRDFRLVDNLGLIECCKKSSEILPIFIFTPEQIENNEYFSYNAFQFMVESLQELNVHYYYGDNIKILKEIYKKYKYDNIYFNMDYTPYARKRDDSINTFCKENNINCFMIEDYLLSPIKTYLKVDGTPYQKYTPFKNNAIKIEVMNPCSYKIQTNKFIEIDYKFDLKKYTINKNILIHGGRQNALNILKNINNYKDYDKTRNTLSISTTHLSAYIKYGCVSIREVYKAFSINEPLINQLYWREFYYYLAYYFPHVLQGKSLKEKYDKIKWGNNMDSFNAWKQGLTGFPVVDAGMRELNETGFMHNRGRLITSGILIKILNCDWRLGEKYFASKLIDYDPSVNNGNWQWVSGSGADSQPYNRIFSPWQQAIDNDHECLYIKKWIPELKDVSNKDILDWGNTYHKYKVSYPSPIADYKFMRKEILKVYKQLF